MEPGSEVRRTLCGGASALMEPGSRVRRTLCGGASVLMEPGSGVRRTLCGRARELSDVSLARNELDWGIVCILVTVPSVYIIYSLPESSHLRTESSYIWCLCMSVLGHLYGLQ